MPRMTKDQALIELATGLSSCRARTFDAETFLDLAVVVFDDLGIDTTPLAGMGSSINQAIQERRETFAQLIKES